MYTHLDVTTSTATCWPCTNLAHKSRILGLPLVQTSQAPRQTLPRRWVSRCVLLHRTWLAPWHQTAPGIAPTVSGSPSWLNKKKTMVSVSRVYCSTFSCLAFISDQIYSFLTCLGIHLIILTAWWWCFDVPIFWSQTWRISISQMNSKKKCPKPLPNHQ